MTEGNDTAVEKLSNRVEYLAGRVEEMSGRVNDLSRRVDEGFAHVNDRFDALQRTLVQFAALVIAALIGLIATQA